MDPDADIEGKIGSLDDTALEQIRDGFTILDGLVDESGFDSLLAPSKLIIRLGDWSRDAV